MYRLLALAVFSALAAPSVRADERKSPAEHLQGTWLFDEAVIQKRSELGRVAEAVVTVSGDSFALSKPMGAKAELKGTLAFDPKNPQAVDLKIAEFDLSELQEGYKVPAGTLPALYKYGGDRLTLCFPRDYKGKRPAAFTASTDAFLVTLVRAPRGFQAFPREIKVTVVGVDGKPVAGATVCQQMSGVQNPDRKKPVEWVCRESVKCDANGTVVIPGERLRAGVLIARGPANDTLGLARVSPAGRATGTVLVDLRPQVRVTGTMTCDELTKAGQPIGTTRGFLHRDGDRVASYFSSEGKFEFLAPPGQYTLNLNGSEVGDQWVDITVPDASNEFTVEPVAMTARALAVLKGKPAPELTGIVGWKGEKTRFADLRGKYVLVEFWGYWCGPCVGSMPVLIELHEKFADKGLVIVGVHVDVDGEVDTVAKLDAKLAAVRKDLWKGKDIPFSSALASGAGQRGGPVSQYGIQGFPTAILIDRDGNVVGQFHARDIKSATTEIAKRLAEKK